MKEVILKEINMNNIWQELQKKGYQITNKRVLGNLVIL